MEELKEKSRLRRDDLRREKGKFNDRDKKIRNPKITNRKKIRDNLGELATEYFSFDEDEIDDLIIRLEVQDGKE